MQCLQKYFSRFFKKLENKRQNQINTCSFGYWIVDERDLIETTGACALAQNAEFKAQSMARLYILNNNKQQIDKYVLNHLRMTQQKKAKQAFIYAIGHREFSVRKLKSLLINQFANAHSCCVQTIAIFLV